MSLRNSFTTAIGRPGRFCPRGDDRSVSEVSVSVLLSPLFEDESRSGEKGVPLFLGVIIGVLLIGVEGFLLEGVAFLGVPRVEAGMGLS
jgi:hypothetical protein